MLVKAALPFIIFFTIICASNDIKDADVKEILANVLNRLTENEDIIVTLENRVQSLEKTVREQNLALNVLTRELHTRDNVLEKTYKKQSLDFKALKREPAAGDWRIRQLQRLIKSLGMHMYGRATDDNANTGDEDMSAEGGHMERQHTDSYDGVGRINPRQIQDGSPIAFYAKKNNPETTVGQNVRFNAVISNLGGSYNPQSGIFVAPVAGIYVFSATIATVNNNSTFYGLYRNNIQTDLFDLKADSSETSSFSRTVIFDMAKGDTVHIFSAANNRPPNTLFGSSFSGFLLSPGLPSFTIVG